VQQFICLSKCEITGHALTFENGDFAVVA